MNLLNANNKFNVWDRVSLKETLKVSRGNTIQTLPKGSRGFVVQSEPLVVELYDIKDTLELTEEYLTKEQ